MITKILIPIDEGLTREDILDALLRGLDLDLDEGDEDVEKDFHLPGQHDQSTHGLWSEGGRERALEKEAAFLGNRAREAEPKITADVKDVIGTGNLRGLEERLKTGESLRRKMESRAKMTGKSPTAVALKISDAVRYTAEFEPGGYAQGMRRTLIDLGRKGYKVERVKNYWGQGDDFDGVTAVLRSPDGMRFEMQFHTPETNRTKEKSHKLYEKFRASGDSKEAKSLVVKMRSLWRRVVRPAGATAIGTLVTTGV